MTKDNLNSLARVYFILSLLVFIGIIILGTVNLGSWRIVIMVSLLFLFVWQSVSGLAVAGLIEESRKKDD